MTVGSTKCEMIHSKSWLASCVWTANNDSPDNGTVNCEGIFIGAPLSGRHVEDSSPLQNVGASRGPKECYRSSLANDSVRCRTGGLLCIFLGKGIPFLRVAYVIPNNLDNAGLYHTDIVSRKDFNFYKSNNAFKVLLFTFGKKENEIARFERCDKN
ncbi:hypothetical protein CEXT_188771 [Caerostris extrusa]|uniref:Uncharacterized protein n=1 Tax=Caerostris extrusa TaxID=172846 RepID=A0AAV4NSM5_CAEEX|nr:hypothetical protein CEXT_188771 [Caerostris extrusa]